MGKIKYLIRCIFNMNFGRMFRDVRSIAKNNNRVTFFVLIDMIWCALRYGAGYSDYRIFGFAGKSAALRKTYVTRGINNQLIKKLNRREDYEKFENKVLFNKTFKDYVGRDWIFLKDATLPEFAEFISRHKVIMVKPIDNLCGHGIEKVEIAENADAKELWDILHEKGQLLVEQFVVQHQELAVIYSLSVNTLRLTTVSNADDVHVVYKVVRTGGGGSTIDNTYFGGLYAYLDEDGTVITDAHNGNGEKFAAHPDSGVVFKGLKIPFYAEAERAVKAGARVVPGIRYIGWDVAITPDGPIFIEANHNPSYTAFKIPADKPEDEMGLLPAIKAAARI